MSERVERRRLRIVRKGAIEALHRRLPTTNTRPVVACGGIGEECFGRGNEQTLALRHYLDADFLMWQLHHRLARDRLPTERVVVHFSLRGRSRKRRGPHLYWLVLERPQVELCLTDPGHEVDLYVEAELRAFAQVWLGDAALASAVRDGTVKLAGARSLVKAFPTWLLLSRFAQVPRPVQ